MKLHVFNPEHDIALASNLSNFTAPYAGRTLRSDLGFLPALWADGADAVLVDDVTLAQERFENLVRQTGMTAQTPQFVSKRSVSSIQFSRIEPWGWDMALRSQLLRMGIAEEIVPTVDEINDIRNLSHRQNSVHVLKSLQQKGTTGEAFYCQEYGKVVELSRNWGHFVLKSPWSSSGRGVRFVENELTLPLEQWIRNVLNTQGGIMVEPAYQRVMDFGMEFIVDERGKVSYQGLSLFHTSHGAYLGNLLISEERKLQQLTPYVKPGLLEEVKDGIIEATAQLYKGHYCGPFGVDMMVVADKEKNAFLLHPCVEINLRRTMGHVALALSSRYGAESGLMLITTQNGHYDLNIEIDRYQEHHCGDGAEGIE